MKQRLIFSIVLLISLHAHSLAQGSGYCGPYNASAPIVWNGKHDTIISGLKIENPNGNCVELSNCTNITITNCRFGPSKGEGVTLYKCSNVNINNCSMDSIETGVYALESQGVNINYNDVKNVQGPSPRGQMVQFDKVNGTGNRINWNAGENISGQSFPEDEISLYMSNGTAADSIQVIGNWIRGGGPSTSGGGIMCGDGGGSYIMVKNNSLVNPGQYGIAVSSGNNIMITNNKIYSREYSFTNVGLYIWNQYSTSCDSITASGNEINWTNNQGASNGCWNAGNCGPVIWNSNTCDANIDSTILPSKIIGRCITTFTDNIKASYDNVDIFPNPSNASFFLKIQQDLELQNTLIKIYDIYGKELNAISISNYKTIIHGENLQSGIYFYNVFNKNKIISKGKLIIQK